MDYAKNFILHCNNANIDFERVFSFVYSANLKNNRIKCRSSHLARKEEQLFIIGYSKELQLYFVWALHDKKARNLNYFSANINDIFTSKNGINYIEKNREFSGWGKEKVYVFNKEQIDIFLKIIKELHHEISVK